MFIHVCLYVSFGVHAFTIVYMYVKVLFTLLFPLLFPLSSVAAGNSKGFVVANYYTKMIVFIHTTVQAYGIANISKVQNLRRSIRSSMRKRANTTAADDRQRVAATLNLELGITKQPRGGPKPGVSPRGRAFSERLGSPASDSEVETRPSPVATGYVSHLTFSETHISCECLLTLSLTLT